MLLKRPENTLSIIGIDPGSNMVGFSEYFIDPNSLDIISSRGWSIKLSHYMKGSEEDIEMFGERFFRLQYLKAYMDNLLLTTSPIAVGCESPFINKKFPLSGMVLSEVLQTIKKSIYDYSQLDGACTYKQFSPSEVKNAVHVKGGKGKDVVRDGVLALSDIKYSFNIKIEDLDEHAIDALAVGYAMFKLLRK